MTEHMTTVQPQASATRPSDESQALWRSSTSTGAQGGAAALLPEPASVGPALLQIPVLVQIVIGSMRLPLSRLAELSPGAMLNLDQKIGEPASILVNGRLIARGNLFVSEGEDERLGITITDVASGGEAGL